MSILKRPIITEKTQGLNAKNKYTFEVGRDANKISIAAAVEKMYGVTVEKVNTITQIGKKKSRMTRTKISSGKTATYKKAIVTLKEGEIIDFYAEL
ncbi:MAG: 50S ribosomal protein L23 [Leadbetterella sp.]|uniref:50S ribosomal protein L23 n=1 Tax=Leadbetterella sp. DM7 TaxID=3235085 RepID=UPI0028872FC5|nr:50S ribosomal protein L23 [Leadbetterella sp.]